MDGKRSKFDYDVFYGDGETFLCINADRYNLEEAKKIASEQEFGEELGYKFEKGYVRHRAGTDSDGEKHVGWWYEDYTPKDKNRFVLVYRFYKK